MECRNPILRGLYPDPSICCVDGAYYLVNSTFEYTPGVPVHKSSDLVHWEQIGNCLTRTSQLDLHGVPPSGGVFAPTIRWHDGLFYMLTSSFSGTAMPVFYVTAEDPAGPWSEPVTLDFEAIDPCFYWEDGRTYVFYTMWGKISGVEIDLASGTTLDGPHFITTGTGGRDAEGPHVFKRGDWYYLMLAEGGTRTGHMECLMRSSELWGPYEASPLGPVVTNRELSGNPIQRTGHADLVTGPDGHEYLVTLGTREVETRSLLGRETMLTPVAWTDDGWLRTEDGSLPAVWETDLGEQDMDWSFSLDMSSTEMPMRVISPRDQHPECYEFTGDALEVKGCGRGLDDGDSCFWAIRQPEFDVEMRVSLEQVELEDEADEVGLAALITLNNHLSGFLTVRDGRRVAVIRRRVGDIDDQRVYDIDALVAPGGPIELSMRGSPREYVFSVNGTPLGSALAEHVTCENAGTQNTGVVDGLLVSGAAAATVTALALDVLER